MTAVAIPGGLWVPEWGHWFGAFLPTNIQPIIDAAGEAVQMIGTVCLEGGSGSKTISSAGGKIGWLAENTVFSDAGTTIRVGIQDVDLTAGPPARGDGTFDVYDDLVGGTDTITSLAWKTCTMSTGSKTLSHGDLICVAVEVQSRGGVSDTTRVQCASLAGLSVTSINAHMPQVVTVAAGPTYSRQNAVPNCLLEFDDGTRGWIDGGWVSNTAPGTTSMYTARSFDSGTNPDEYALIFSFPAPVTIDAISAIVNPEGAANSAFELIVYADPTVGTPTALATISVDPNTASQNASNRRWVFTLPTPLNLAANTLYALAVRPTTTNDVSVFEYTVDAFNTWKAHQLGTSCYYGTRQNQSGVFIPTLTARFFAAVRVSKISDGAGGGGSGYSRGRIVNAGGV